MRGDTSQGDQDHDSRLALLRRLRDDIAVWNKKAPTNVTYEEIGAVCSSLDKEFGTGRNAAIAPYWLELAKGLGRSTERAKRRVGDDSLAGLIQRAAEWIKRGVADELERRTRQSGSRDLEAFLNLVSSQTAKWSVATLNHDCCIEDAIAKLGQELCDGFSSLGSVRDFLPHRLRSGNDRMLLKLHGSVDWRWHPDRENYVKIAAGTDDDDVFRTSSMAPELLIGTFNKLEDYSYVIYPYLFAALDRLLAHASVIVVSGYGFADAGVNMRIFSELRYRPALRMLVIHPEPTKLITDAPFHAYQELKRHACSNRVVFCQCKFAEAVLEPHRENLIQFFEQSDRT